MQSFIHIPLKPAKIKIKKVPPLGGIPRLSRGKNKRADKIYLPDKKAIDKKLMEIYENDDGTMPDMAHFQKEKTGRFIRSIVALLLACIFLVAVAWAGFFVIQPGSHFSEEDVILSVSGEEKIVVGKETQYRIRYRNAQNVALNNALLQVRYPEGFILTNFSVAPGNEAKDEWHLGSLDAEESGLIDIFGKMYGNVGEKQSFRVFLDYTAENFSSEFQKVASLNVETFEAPVILAVEGPDKVLPGSEMELIITVSGVGEDKLDNLAVELDGGALFSIKKSEPEQDKFFDDRWGLGSLEAEQKIKIKGVFNPVASETSGSVTVNLIGWKDEDKSVEPYIYSSYSYSVAFLQTDVAANLVINGTTANMTVEPGELLTGTIMLRNSGEASLQNASVRVIVDAPSFEKKCILDWAQMGDSYDASIVGEQLNDQKRRGTIVWTARNVSDLSRIDKDEEVLIDFSLPIKDGEDVDLTAFVDSEIKAVLEVRYNVDGEEKIISGAPIIMTLNSDADMEIRDSITLDGEKEVHSVQWIVTNSFHELKDIKLSADIYGDINFTEVEKGGGEVNFDAEGQKLIWMVDSMPTALDVLVFEFKIILNKRNPTQTNLTSKVTFEAMDTVTNKQILKAGKEILLNVE